MIAKKPTNEMIPAATPMPVIADCGSAAGGVSSPYVGERVVGRNIATDPTTVEKHIVGSLTPVAFNPDDDVPLLKHPTPKYKCASYVPESVVWNT